VSKWLGAVAVVVAVIKRTPLPCPCLFFLSFFFAHRFPLHGRSGRREAFCQVEARKVGKLKGESSLHELCVLEVVPAHVLY